MVLSWLVLPSTWKWSFPFATSCWVLINYIETSGELGWDRWLVSDDYVTVLSSLLFHFGQRTNKYHQIWKKKSVAFVYTGKRNSLEALQNNGAYCMIPFVWNSRTCKTKPGWKKNHQNNEYLYMGDLQLTWEGYGEISWADVVFYMMRGVWVTQLNVFTNIYWLYT